MLGDRGPRDVARSVSNGERDRDVLLARTSRMPSRDPRLAAEKGAQGSELDAQEGIVVPEWSQGWPTMATEPELASVTPPVIGKDGDVEFAKQAQARQGLDDEVALLHHQGFPAPLLLPTSKDALIRSASNAEGIAV